MRVMTRSEERGWEWWPDQKSEGESDDQIRRARVRVMIRSEERGWPLATWCEVPQGDLLLVAGNLAAPDNHGSKMLGKFFIWDLRKRRWSKRLESKTLQRKDQEETHGSNHQQGAKCPRLIARCSLVIPPLQDVFQQHQQSSKIVNCQPATQGNIS